MKTRSEKRNLNSLWITCLRHPQRAIQWLDNLLWSFGKGLTTPIDPLLKKHFINISDSEEQNQSLQTNDGLLETNSLLGDEAFYEN